MLCGPTRAARLDTNRAVLLAIASTWPLLLGFKCLGRATAPNSLRSDMEPAAKRLRRSSGVPGGSLDYYIQNASSRPGPADLEELLGWLDWLANLCFQNNDEGRLRRMRMQDILQRGFISHRDCSGKLTVETVLNMFSELCDLPDKWLHSFRACDIDAVCQNVILNSGTISPCHVFSSLEDRLPETHRKWIMKARPTEGTPHDVAKIAYDKIREYLIKNSKHLFSRGVHATNCLQHPGTTCPISWVQDEDSDIAETRKPLTSTAAGTPCLPWCLAGSRKTGSHHDVMTFVIWIQEAVEAKYSFICLDSAEHFEKQRFVSRVPANYLIRYMFFGPQDLGFPNRRTRTYMVAVDLDSLVWLGATTQEAFEKDFNDMFACYVQVEADVFARSDTLTNVMRSRVDMAHDRGLYGNSSQLAALGTRALLAGGDQERYDKYNNMLTSGSRVGLGGSFVCDISQDASERPRAGAWLPSFTRKSVVVSLTADHVFTSNEVDAAMGWPLLTSVQSSARLQHYCAFDFDKLSRCKRRKLAGNGQHLAQVASFFMFVMSHCFRRAKLMQLSPNVQGFTDKREEDDDAQPKSVFVVGLRSTGT